MLKSAPAFFPPGLRRGGAQPLTLEVTTILTQGAIVFYDVQRQGLGQEFAKEVEAIIAGRNSGKKDYLKTVHKKRRVWKIRFFLNLCLSSN